MALAKQFYSSFKSYNGWEYYLEIWVEGYGGSASEISIGAGGPVITYGTDQQDRFSPILSSKLELPFMVTNATQDAFIKNIREQFNERDVYIHLYRANSSDYSSVAPLWSGYVLMDLSASPDLYYPYPVTLTAVDGLALLKEIDFVQSGTAGSYSDSDMYSSNGRFTYWIKEILLKIGASTTTEGSTQDYKFTTAINWFNSVMPTITQSTDPFYQTKCGTKMFFSKDSDGNFTVVNTYDVLLNLLKHWGARIIYWKHIFYIVQIQEYNTAESGTYANPDNINTRTYLKTGAFDSSSDNLGDSYWTRYNLLIDDVTGGIQKLTGSQFNYLPQLKRTQANFLDYGNKNYFGGLPFDITTGETDVILQDTFEDVSSDGAMLLIIPLDVTIVQQYNGSLDLRILFRLFITDGSTTYYLRYNPTNTPKFYWESSTTVNLNNNQTRWYSPLDNIVGTQTKVGFHQLIEFKDSGGSAITLSGEWKAYTDIDTWGVTNTASSFYFYASVGGIGTTSTQVYEPSLTTVYYSNTLNASYQTPLNPVVLGTTSQQTTGMTGTSYNYTSNNIINYHASLNINPFEGKLLIVKTTGSGAIYGSQVMVTPQTTTNDVEVVDFGDLIWGDTLLASSEGSLKVWNGSAFVKSNVTGTWGLGSTSGTNSFTEMLLSEYLYGQTKVVESPSMQLVIGETNKNQNDGSGSRPNYVNPIGRLKGYSATGTTPYYIFKSGSFHLLRDEINYEGYQIIRDTQTVTKTHDIIIGPDVLQDKTNKIGQKTPSSNTLAAKLTQNSFITTISSTKSAYGNDVAVNGIFSSDSSWTKGTGWSIASNKATFATTGSTSEIKQDILTNALTYKIVVSVSVSAGGLSVKAGSSGSATVLSASGTYEIFSTCSGSTDVIFEASAAFEGYIEKVVVQQQVPITSININAIGTAVFKTNDVLNIANFDGNEINEFTVSSDQGASDTSISVTSKLITEDILEGSIILVNQNDLAAQYQNKTKGTVGGFTIDADGIAKGGVEITGWLDSDTMSGATANNVPTAESVKAYVDAQVGTADTLQEVTDLGNTTTNSIMIGSSSSPTEKLHVVGDALITGDSMADAFKPAATGEPIKFKNFGSTEVARITDGGNLLIGTTTDSGAKLNVQGSLQVGVDDTGYDVIFYGATSGAYLQWDESGDALELKDSTYLYLGTGNDLQLYHNGTDSFITNHTGDFKIIQYADDKDIIFQSDDGSGGVETYFYLDGSTGRTRFNDSKYLVFGTDQNLFIVHDGTNSAIQNYTSGDFHIDQRVADKDMLFRADDGAGGTATYFFLDGSSATHDGSVTTALFTQFPDKSIASFGSSNDLRIYHDGSNSQIFNYTGNLEIKNHSDDADIIFQCDDGSGGITPYITLDGGAVFTKFHKQTVHIDSVKAEFGNGGDLAIQHNATNSLIENYTGDLYIKNNADDKDIIFQSDDGSGGVTAYITLDGSAGYTTVQKQIRLEDSVEFRLGTGGDSYLVHNGSNFFLVNDTGDLTIKNSANDKDIIFQCDDGSGSDETYFYLDGSAGGAAPFTVWPDSSVISCGGGHDLRIEHTGSYSRIRNYTGNMNIDNYGDDTDIIFQNDDGSGGITPYITLDGSQTTINLQKNVLIGTTTDGSKRLDVVGAGPSTTFRLSNSTSDNTTKYGAILGRHYSNSEEDVAGMLITSSSNATAQSVIIGGGISGVNSANIIAFYTGANYTTLVGTERMRVTNSGNLLIGTTTDSGVYKLDVFGKARVQSVFELDDVLTLNAISTPSDPADGKSSIYMDSADGAIKVKINVGGTVVTRTIASFE